MRPHLVSGDCFDETTGGVTGIGIANLLA